MARLTVNGVELNVYDEGAGHPLLFVHGFPLDHSMWRGQLAEFSRTHRVIAPDLRGFGQSGVTAGTVAMSQFADDLAAILEKLEVRTPVTLCGLSMGGYIAWPFIEQYPHLLHALVLCDTRAAADSPEGAAGRLKTANDVLAKGAESLAAAMLPRLFSAATIQQSPDMVEETRRTIVQTDREGIAAALRGMAARPDRRDLLARIRCPVLVVVGREDQITPVDEMREMAAAIGGATFVEIPDAGHMAPLENPTTVNAALVNFLAKSGP